MYFKKLFLIFISLLKIVLYYNFVIFIFLILYLGGKCRPSNAFINSVGFHHEARSTSNEIPSFIQGIIHTRYVIFFFNFIYSISQELISNTEPDHPDLPQMNAAQSKIAQVRTNHLFPFINNFNCRF